MIWRKGSFQEQLLELITWLSEPHHLKIMQEFSNTRVALRERKLFNFHNSWFPSLVPHSSFLFLVLWWQKSGHWPTAASLRSYNTIFLGNNICLCRIRLLWFSAMETQTLLLINLFEFYFGPQFQEMYLRNLWLW